VAANPQTKPVDCESAENWQLPSTSTIAIVDITTFCVLTGSTRAVCLQTSHNKGPVFRRRFWRVQGDNVHKGAGAGA